MDNFPLIELLLGNLPLYFVWLAALILAVIYWKRSPLASISTLLAVLLLFVASLVDPRASPVFLRWLNRIPLHWLDIKTFLAIRLVINTVITVTAWVFILVAIFSKRKINPSIGKEQLEQP